MRFDLEWLLDHLDAPPPADTLAERLTACGFLVEVREPAGEGEVWDVEVTTNRPDVMSHRGLAREAAVACGVGLKEPELELEEGDEPAAELAEVEISAPELCSRYVARVVRGVRVGESPEWMRRRLERCGVRPVNNVVDATNYVLLDLGHPLHAFDLARLAGRRVVVRRAAPREQLETLDGEQRRLDEETLVIADAKRPLALAGIMGGSESEISDETVDVLLESAHFEPLSIRRSARRLAMHTEASHRFERGCDPEMAATACDAAAALIARLAGGRVARGRIDVYPRPWQGNEIEISLAGLNAFAGLEIAAGQVAAILAGLEIATELAGDRARCHPPSFRVDLERAPDLYEEVIRHLGYDRIPASLPQLRSAPGRRHPDLELVDRARRAAVAVGLVEVMTFSFIDPAADALVDSLPISPGAALPLLNPLATTQGTMRRSLLPGLLAATRETLNRGERSLALFEQGRVFFLSEGLPREEQRLAVVVGGPSAWGEQRKLGFFDLKGVVEGVCGRLFFPRLSWRPGGAPWLDPGEGAVLEADDGRILGVAGRLGGAPAQHWELRPPLYVAELLLAAAPVELPRVELRPLPRHPAIAADLTVEHATGLSYAELRSVVADLAGELVEAVELRDRYRGEGLPPDRVRTTLRLLYRHPERSLTQEEVNHDQERLRGALAARLPVTLA